MTNSSSDNRTGAGSSRVAVAPLEDTSTFADRAYAALRDVILNLDIYDSPSEVRLDERRLASDLGISRTPVREAMAQLEREGFVRSVPRRGIYVVRKTKAEVIELITAWAALESMAARLITQNASDEEISRLRAMFATFEDGRLRANLDEYSEVNIEFHQTIIRMSGNRILVELAENLFAHMRMIRRKTIGERDRADRSIADRRISCAITRWGWRTMSPGTSIISTEAKRKRYRKKNVREGSVMAETATRRHVTTIAEARLVAETHLREERVNRAP
jgi:DNA-binding GntR family transcriptional regulator